MRFHHPSPLALSALLALLPLSGLAPRVAADVDVVIGYETRAVGEVEDCGCHSHPKGGFAKRAALINTLRDESENVLILSGGDNVSNKGDRQWNRQSQMLLSMMGEMGTGAAAVQSQDLFLGLDVLNSAAAEHGLSLICANLVGEDGKPLYPAYKVFTYGDKKLGVLAVTDPRLQSAIKSMPNGLKFDDPAPALVAGVKALHDQEGCDAVVLLFGGRREQALERCKDLQGVDLIFYGNATISQRVPAETDAGVPVYTAANRGKDFGEITLTMKDDGTVELSPMLIHELDKNYAEEPSYAERVNAFKAEIEVEHTRAQEIETMAREFSAAPVTDTYLGTDTCARCHADIAKKFEGSAHAHAMATLEAKYEDNNPDCVACHVTGWKEPGGYGIDPQNRAMLAGVQCEACHGYGTAHDRSTNAMAAPKDMCLRCHDAANSPEFDFDRYWAKIKH